MTITVRPPLVFMPNPRPSWWGTNPDASEIAAFLPTGTTNPANLYESAIPPKKLPPPISYRMAGPQPPFIPPVQDVVPRKLPPDTAFINITAILPTAATQPLNLFDGFPPPKKIPPHMPLALRSQAPPSAAVIANFYPSPPPPKPLPPPIPVRVGQGAVIVPSNLAQAQLEFDPTGKAKIVWPVDAAAPNFALLTSIVVPPPPPPIEYLSKVSVRWPEDAAPTNVAAQPPLIGIAQALDDFSPTGLPKKQWSEVPIPPNIAAQPNSAIPPIITYEYPSKVRVAWPEDAAPPNIPIQPIGTVIAGFNYDYPSVPKRFWTIEPAPQDFWALPNTLIAPALYDYPALPAKKWPGDYFPFTNWIEETPPLPPGLVPPAVYDWPKHLTLTLDDFQNPNTLQPPPTPIYIPEIGYEIYIPFRQFTIATPVRTFFLSVVYRAFTISRKTVQTFDVKDPAESWPLTFNMAPDLFAGETLVAPPTVTVSLIQGADPNPSGILNGVAGFDQTSTQVIQPVTGGVAGCTYELVVTCPTSNPNKTLTLVGALPVQRS